jgi:hypothetical protein
MEEELAPAEIAYLADRAVKELIGRVQGYGELAEVIMGCIRDTPPNR